MQDRKVLTAPFKTETLTQAHTRKMIQWGCRHPCHTPVVVGGSRRVCIERECLDKYLVRAVCPDVYMLVGGRPYKGVVETDLEGRKRLRFVPEGEDAVLVPGSPRRAKYTGEEDVDEENEDEVEEPEEDPFDPAPGWARPPPPVEHNERPVPDSTRAEAYDISNRTVVQEVFDDILAAKGEESFYSSNIAVLDLLLANFASGAYETLGFREWPLRFVLERLCEWGKTLRMREATGFGKTAVSVPEPLFDPRMLPPGRLYGVSWRTVFLHQSPAPSLSPGPTRMPSPPSPPRSPPRSPTVAKTQKARSPTPPFKSPDDDQDSPKLSIEDWKF